MSKFGILLLLAVQAACAALIGAPAAASPDLLVYRDGNRATGRLIAHQGNLITFASDRFGQLVVSDTEAQVTIGATTAAPAQAAMPPAAPTAVQAESTAAGRPAPGNRWLHLFQPWQGNLTFALEAKQENNSRNNILTELRVSRSWRDDEVRFGARYEYTREAEHPTTDLTKGNVYWRHDFDALGQRLFVLVNPETEFNQNYHTQTLAVDYLLLRAPLGFGLTMIDRAPGRLRVGVAENRFDLWFWTLGRSFHAISNAESLFLEAELQLPYDIRITDRGTWYCDLRSGDSGYDNQAEITKKLSQSFSLGLRYELRANIPATDVSHFSLWRAFFGVDF